MDLATYTPLIIAIIVLILKPGPLVMAFITMAFAGKWRSILSLWMGYASSLIVIYIFFLNTLSLLPAGFGIAFLFIKAIASMLFISLGIKGLAAEYSGNALDYSQSSDVKDKVEEKNLFKNYVTGAALQLSNPYDYVFILTVIPSIMGTSYFPPIDIFYILVLVLGLNTIINAAYILPILYFRKLFPIGILRKISIGSSVLMVLIGLFIFSTMFIRSGLEDSGLLSMVSSIYT